MPITAPVRRPANTLRRQITSLDQEGAPFGIGPRDQLTENPNVLWARQVHERWGGDWLESPIAGLWPDERAFDAMRQTGPVGAAEQHRITSLLGEGWRLRKGTGDGAEEMHSFWSAALAELDTAAILRDALKMELEGWKVFECVGDIRQWEGRDVFMPVAVAEVDSWDFRYTRSGDLVDLAGRASGSGRHERWLTSTNPVARAKWWRPSFGSSRGAYGDALGVKLAPTFLSLLNAMIQGFAQALRAQGFLMVERDGGGAVEKQTRSQYRDDRPVLSATIREALSELSSTGMLQVPSGYRVSWEALESAIPHWIDLWNYFADAARELIQGATLTSSLTGPNGARALGDTHREGEKDIVSCDAHLLAGQLNRFLMPWSQLNADAIFRFPRDRRGLAVISAASLPRFEFAAVDVATPAEQQAAAERMRLAKDMNIGGPPARVDAGTWIRTGRVEFLPEDSEDVTAFEFAEAEPMPPELRPGLLRDPGPLGDQLTTPRQGE